MIRVNNTWGKTYVKLLIKINILIISLNMYNGLSSLHFYSHVEGQAWP